MEKIKNFGQSDFDKNGTFQSNSRVTHCLGGGLVFTYIKEGEKCDLMPFSASKSDNAQPCKKISDHFS